MKHSPLPWVQGKQSRQGHNLINGRGFVMGYIDKSEDAEFIVKACNAHYELVEALERVSEQLASALGVPIPKHIQELLAKTKGV